MTELERILSHLPHLPEGTAPPAWRTELLTFLKTQEAEIARLQAELDKLAPPKKPAPLPALDLEEVEAGPRQAGPAAVPLKFMELQLKEDPPPTDAPAAKGEEHIFEDLEEDEPETAPVLEKKYLVVVDRDLKDLIPQFMKDRQRESDDISLWLRMDDFAKVQATCKASRGVMMTFGFDYLSKLAQLIYQKAGERNRKAAEKLLFEYNFFVDQCRIEYQ